MTSTSPRGKGGNNWNNSLAVKILGRTDASPKKVGKKITMQGRVTPVSVPRQSEQAGSEPSSSCNRNSIVVDNFATLEFKTSRIGTHPIVRYDDKTLIPVTVKQGIVSLTNANNVGQYIL